MEKRRLRIQQVIIQGNLAYIDGTSGEQTTAGNVKLIIKPAGDRLTADLAGTINDIPLSLSGEFGNPDFAQKTEIRNFFITGHWSNQSSGIAAVANSGKETAKSIQKYM